MIPKVLIIEDDPDSREVICVTLSECFECKAVSSREAALALLKSGFIPACVLMDYMMPGMLIEDFVRAVKEFKTEVVLMSAHKNTCEISKDAGIACSFQKPIPGDHLIRVVKQLAGIETGVHKI